MPSRSPAARKSASVTFACYNDAMTVTVEFFGIARQRAGVAQVEVDAANMGEAFDRLAARFPHWAEACLSDGKLMPAFLANVNTTAFVAKRDHPLQDGDHLLILAADVGG